MLYRRTPRNPPTLLLRIVATAGAGTLIGMASCGGETTTANGSVAIPANSPLGPQAGTQGDDDSGQPTPSGFCCGVVGPPPSPPPDDGGPAGLVPCNGFCGGVGSVGYLPDGSMGSIANVPEASVADVEVHGVVPLPEDAGYDAHHVLNGVVVEPPDSGSTIHCPPVCGVVIGLSPNPGH